MKRVLLSLFVSSFIFAQEKSTEVLLPLKNEIKELENKSVKEKKEVNTYEWLSDINLNITQNKNNEDLNTKDYSLSINQEIFNFGGIKSKIDYAQYLFEQQSLKLQMENFEDLNSLYENFINLKINDINIKQNIFNIKNSEIEVEIKTSLYKNGQRDISDLNDAIMKKNSLEDLKMELQLQKVKYINEIKKLSSYEITNLDLPQISLISKENFLENATKKLYASLESNVSKTEYQKTKSSYLPSLKLNASMGIEDSNTKKKDDY